VIKLVSIIAKLQVKEGKMEEAINVLKKIVPKIKEAEPGCLEYIPHTVKGRKDKNTIVFYEKYKDAEALKIHTANLAKSLSEFMPLLEPGMDIKTCSEIV
jgi:quinol monooxygenase YgiN